MASSSSSTLCLQGWSPVCNKIERPKTSTCNSTVHCPPVACRQQLFRCAPDCLLSYSSKKARTHELKARSTTIRLGSRMTGNGNEYRLPSSVAAISGGVHGRLGVEANGGRVQALWLDSNAEVRCDVPLEECWEHWLDREKIPQWMPWISTVKVLEDKPDQSRWTLKYSAFDQDFKFSWVARNMQPVHHQKIHWRAVDGLPNRGAVRFYKNRDDSCQIKMTISYEVPGVLAPLAQAVTPIVEGIIQRDLGRFVDYARTHRLKVPAES